MNVPTLAQTVHHSIYQRTREAYVEVTRTSTKELFYENG